MSANYALPREGSVVVDREADEASEAYVVAVHRGSTAQGWHIDALDATVADVNPSYAALAPVVTVAFVEDVEAADIDGWRDADDLQLAVEAADVRTYDYPAPRLREVDR